MPSKAHRHTNKKPFQPPQNHITSYFTTGNDSTDPSSLPRHSIPHAPVKENAPQLTPAIQASLLSVGMRIRKAVPEGYKTHKTLDAENAMAATISRAEIRLDGASATGAPSAGGGRGGARELTPFCGIHKVGGLAAQQESWVREMSGFGYAAYGGGGCSSQESGASGVEVEDGARLRGGAVSVSMEKKRRRDDYDGYDDNDDEEEECDDEGEEGEMWQLQESFTARRAFAKPVGARTVNGGGRRRQNGGAVQSVPLQSLADNGTDFDEASFLQPWEESEVQMGGM